MWCIVFRYARNAIPFKTVWFNVSDDLGNRVRTNAESIFAFLVKMSTWVKVLPLVQAWPWHSHWSNSLPNWFRCLMCTYMAKGKPGWTRIFFGHLFAIHLFSFAWVTLSAPDFNFLGDANRWCLHQHKRNWFWPFGKVLSSEGKKCIFRRPMHLPKKSQKCLTDDDYYRNFV